MNVSHLQEFIKGNRQEAYFTGGVSEDKVRETEEKLHVSLSKSYKWFLRNYGSGGIFGIDIIGYDMGPSVEIATKDHQKYYGLTEGIIVIEDSDEFVYCLDTNKLNNGECPVIMWDNQEGYGRKLAENFLEYLVERLELAKEVWNEDEEDW